MCADLCGVPKGVVDLRGDVGGEVSEVNVVCAVEFCLGEIIRLEFASTTGK